VIVGKKIRPFLWVFSPCSERVFCNYEARSEWTFTTECKKNHKK